MIRNFVIAGIIFLLAAVPAAAKEWAQKMFTVTTHEFGHVARGSKTEFSFELTNVYEEDVHIADVRTSCGCTTPTVTKSTLKTWEKGAIIAAFNTKSFHGQRNATLTVVIDKPYYAEVQLTVNGYIHTDVDFQPGSVAFGDVDQGQPAVKEVVVNYVGQPKWQITDVRSADANLEVELSDPMRNANGVSYKMLVRLRETAPAGFLNDMLTIVTNDPRLPTVPLPVEGRVVAPLQVSPSALFVGVIEPGQTVTKQLVVRGKVPFHITAIECPDAAFQFKAPAQSRNVHLIPVTFTAPLTAGEINATISISTDLPTGGQTSCLVRGTVKGAARSDDANVVLKPVQPE